MPAYFRYKRYAEYFWDQSHSNKEMCIIQGEEQHSQIPQAWGRGTIPTEERQFKICGFGEAWSEMRMNKNSCVSEHDRTRGRFEAAEFLKSWDLEKGSVRRILYSAGVKDTE